MNMMKGWWFGIVLQLLDLDTLQWLSGPWIPLYSRNVSVWQSVFSHLWSVFNSDMLIIRCCGAAPQRSLLSIYCSFAVFLVSDSAGAMLVMQIRPSTASLQDSDHVLFCKEMITSSLQSFLFSWDQLNGSQWYQTHQNTYIRVQLWERRVQTWKCCHGTCRRWRTEAMLWRRRGQSSSTTIRETDEDIAAESGSTSCWTKAGFSFSFWLHFRSRLNTGTLKWLYIICPRLTHYSQIVFIIYTKKNRD